VRAVKQKGVKALAWSLDGPVAEAAAEVAVEGAISAIMKPMSIRH